MKQVSTAILLACASVSLAVAAAASQGEKWKITSSVQMEGMSMPGQSAEICKEPGEDTVPVRTESNCQVYDVTRSGNVQNFKMRCTGKDAMEGTGQFTYLGKDHYQGKMQMKVEGETMTMSYEGQKLGSCDGAEANLKAKEMVAQAKVQQAEGERQQAEQCRKMAAEAADPGVMLAYCKDPADRKTFCSAVQTHEKFLPMAETEKKTKGAQRPLSQSAELCGFSAEKQRAQLCTSAESKGDLRFIASQCPAESDRLAKAHCAGRRYTAISDQYRGFCSSYASAQQEEANTPAGQAKEALMDKSKRALGGLFGR
jgi:hypothetical protein